MVFEILAVDQGSPLGILPIQEDIFSRATEGTCQWILEDPQFQQWVTGDLSQRTLWLHGPPGCGKTVATSIIVNYLLKNPGNIRPRRSSIAYIYCNSQLSSQQKRPDFIRDILQQLIPGSESPLPVSLDECMKCLREAFRELSRTYIIIDALDECLDANHLIRTLRSLHDMDENIYLLITSRHLEGYHGRLGDQISIYMQATAGDIKKYIQQSIKDSIKLEKAAARDSTLEADITDYVVQNAGGMFLLPRLWLDQLSKQHTPRHIRTMLRSSEFQLPLELSGLYNEAIQRIQRQDPEDIHLAHDVLVWITRAREPLTVSALRHALGIHEGDTQFHEDGVPDLDSIISVCAGLVTVHRQTSGNVEFGLAHPTLTKFFHGNPQLLSHKVELLAQTCLTYLSIALSQVDFPKNEEDYVSWVHNTMAPLEVAYPLLHYAFKYWPVHACEVGSTTFWERTCEFLCDKPPAPRVSILIGRLVDRIPDSESAKLPPADISPMHLAVLFDLPTAATMLYESLDAADTNGNTPLIWAAYGDRARIVQLFLSRCPGPDLNHVGLKGKSAIFYAAENGNVKVLEILSREWARIDTGKHDSQGLTPAITAAKNGHVRCINILAENFKAQVDLADTVGATPLFHAIRAGHIDVIRALLTHGADATYATTEGETALSEAILGDQKEAMTILVEHLILHNHGKHLESVIHKVIFKIASNGNVPIFQNILQLPKQLGTIADTAGKNQQRLYIPGLRFDQLTDEAGRTPLSYAAEAGHQDMTQELLKEYGNFHFMVRDKNHWTPLHYAIFNGNIQVLQLLLLASGRRGLYFTGPPDSGEDSDYSDDDEKAWLREGSNRIIKDLSTLVGSPAFIRPGKSPAISKTPTGIIPCVQLLLEKFQPSNRLNLMLKRILHHAVLQTIILHPDHKHRLDEESTWGTYKTEYLEKRPMVRHIREGEKDEPTQLVVYIIGRKGHGVEVVLKCGPNDTVDDERRPRRFYGELDY